jgi:peptidoglycan/xylan/chitin deacetylase (PgdA/CDA1 family)
MGVDDLREMTRAGMYVGSHGFDHYWLDSLDEACQRREIELSTRFLESIGTEKDAWTLAYPYGAYDESVLRLLRGGGFRAAFTTEVRLATIGRDDPLLLPRLDTNDLPKQAQAPMSGWTQQITTPEPAW